MYLSYLITAWTQLETSLGAIARIRSHKTQTIAEERPGEDQEAPRGWPQHGQVEIRNITAAYKFVMSHKFLNCANRFKFYFARTARHHDTDQAGVKSWAFAEGLEGNVVPSWHICIWLVIRSDLVENPLSCQLSSTLSPEQS
jgi:hypothetical protein